MASKEEMLAKVRAKMEERKGSGRKRDSDEFRPPKAQNNQTLEYKFVVLPPIGDDWSNWCHVHGSHYLGKKVYQCPRVHDSNTCSACETGFDLMSETDIKEEKSKIAKLWLPRTYYAMNIWFPPYKSNPEDLRDKVMWYSAPKTIYDIMESCIYRDDAGDNDDPRAFGLFFDPEKCFVFKLEIYKKGDFNSYEKSKFLAAPKNLLELAKSKEKIKEILSQRHDIVSKFEDRDPAAIEAAVTAMITGELQPTSKSQPAKSQPSKAAATEDEDEDELVGSEESDAKVSSGGDLLEDSSPSSDSSENLIGDDELGADPELANLLSDLQNVEE